MPGSYRRPIVVQVVRTAIQAPNMIKVTLTSRCTTRRSNPAQGNRQSKARSSLMSDSADCFAGTVARPDGLVLVDKLIAPLSSRHRFVNPAGTASYSSVIRAFRMGNSAQSGLGSISGQDDVGDSVCSSAREVQCAARAHAKVVVLLCR